MREPRYPLPRVVLCIHDKVGTSPPHTHCERGCNNRRTPFDSDFLVQFTPGVVRFSTGSHVTGTGRERGTMKRPHPLPLMFDNTFTGRSTRQVSTMILPQLLVFHKSKNFTSDYEIRMPPTVPVNHYSDPEGQHNRIRIL
ncbi:hypothetical protein V6N13_081700 [Hibiscus sabdariffa]